jgi:hypothetical protein
MWNAPASASVPALDQLDMNAPATGAHAFKKRIARLRAKLKHDMRAFAPSRSTSESLRKFVK